jgi:crotonobetainyl-CoA:carnitine CoA-transferase CaiB-like acyl-CoA transferase
MGGPLAGFMVVDCSSGLAGPRATGMLADYGAEVVWIEPPGGDRLRHELSPAYSVFNRGKRSLCLDLKDTSDLRRIDELLADADVFVESWRPGVADRLGLGFETLHARHPSLVCASISGFGSDGPHRERPGYESLVHALVGTMGEQPGHRSGPIFEGLPFATIGAANLAAIGICAALYRRFDDGFGRHVETSLLDGALSFLSMLWGDADVPPPPRDPGGSRLVARNFRCADDATIGVHTGAVGAFGRLMKLLGLDDKIPSSADGRDMGIRLTDEQRTLIDERLPEIFATRPRAEWLEVLVAEDICAIPLLEPLDVLDEPQVRHNEMVVSVEDPELGLLEQIAPPLRFARTPARVRGPAPEPGSGCAPDAALAKHASRSAPDPNPTGGGLDERAPLAGLRVLDLGAYFAVPYGSRLLADLGADVIRLETPAGDPNRGLEVIFRSSHAGKRSIALDLKHPESRLVAEQLLGWADAISHSMRPGVAERLGVGYEQARNLNPEVIYAYGPGWGSSGPQSSAQSFAPLMSGYVGVAFEVAGKFNPPVYPTGNEDPGNGMLGALGILMALIHRRRTGEGQYVEHPQLNAALSHVAHIVRRDGRPIGAMRLDPLQLGFGAADRLYETADGWLCLRATSPAEISGLAQVTEVDLVGDPRFASAEARLENRDVLEELLMKSLASRPTAELLDAFATAGVPALEPSPYNCQAFLRDPANKASGRVGECAHASRGKVREIGRLIRISHVTDAPHRLAPELGEHTDEILEELGNDTATIERLKAVSAVMAASQRPQE